jgi:hypothetical protein
MLVVHHVALLLLLHCCMCHGEVLPLPIALCKCWNSFTIGMKTREKKNLFIFNDLIIHFFQIFFFFFFFFHIYIYINIYIIFKGLCMLLLYIYL